MTYQWIDDGCFRNSKSFSCGGGIIINYSNADSVNVTIVTPWLSRHTENIYLNNPDLIYSNGDFKKLKLTTYNIKEEAWCGYVYYDSDSTPDIPEYPDDPDDPEIILPAAVINNKWIVVLVLILVITGLYLRRLA